MRKGQTEYKSPFNVGLLAPSAIANPMIAPSPESINAVQLSSSAVYFQADKREPSKRKQVPEVFGNSVRSVNMLVDEAESKFGPV
jgi:hypothetical protein